MNSRDLERAVATFDHMRVWHCEPDQVLFTLMIKSCSINGEVEKALNYMDEMKMLDLYPTEVTYNTLLRVFVKRPDKHREAFKRK